MIKKISVMLGGALFLAAPGPNAYAAVERIIAVKIDAPIFAPAAAGLAPIAAASAMRAPAAANDVSATAFAAPAAAVSDDTSKISDQEPEGAALAQAQAIAPGSGPLAIPAARMRSGALAAAQALSSSKKDPGALPPTTAHGAPTAKKTPASSFLNLSPKTIARENTRLKSLGLDLKGQDALIAQPFSLPPTSYRAFLVPSKSYLAPPPKKVLADDMLADLDILEFAMRQNYSGWEVAEKRGWDWKAWFDNWRALLAKQSGRMIRTTAAFQPLADLKKFQPDNHTLPLIPNGGFDSESSTALLQAEPHGPATALINGAGETFKLDPQNLATQPQKVLLGGSEADFTRFKTGYAISYPDSFGKAVAVLSGGEKIPLVSDYDPKGKKRLAAALKLARTKTDVPSYRRISKDIGYLRMPVMEGDNSVPYERLAKRLPTLSDGKEKVLIVDARGNGGGALLDDVLSRWFSPAELLKRASTLIPRVTTKRSDISSSMLWAEHAYEDDLRSAAQAQADKASLGPLIDDLTKPFKPKPVRFTVNKGGGWDYLQHRFDPSAPGDGPIVLLLVDAFVSSNGEMLTALLSTFPKTLIAGVSTAGIGEFGDASAVFLPRTKVPFRIATDHNQLFSDGRSFESHGLMPDVLLNTVETNSPEYIVKLAESLALLVPAKNPPPAANVQFSKKSGNGPGRVPFQYTVLEQPGGKNTDVVYFLHGGGGNVDDVATFLAPQLETARKSFGYDLPRMIGVSFGPFWALNSRNKSPKSGLLDEFLNQVMPYIETQVLSDKTMGRRHLAGLSMGGFNALQLALTAPEKFVNALVVSPALFPFSPFVSQKEIEAFVKRTGSLEHADGKILGVEDILKLFKQCFPDRKSWRQSPDALAARLTGRAAGSIPPMLITAGVHDGKFFEGARKFYELASKAGIKAEWMSLPGGHGATDPQAFARFLLGNPPGMENISR